MCPPESSAGVQRVSPACRSGTPGRLSRRCTEAGRMGWWGRIGWAVVGLSVVGCDAGAGGGMARGALQPADVKLADSCTVGGVRIEVEEGVLGGFAGE